MKVANPGYLNSRVAELGTEGSDPLTYSVVTALPKMQNNLSGTSATDTVSKD